MIQSIKEFTAVLRELQKIDPEFPLQYAVCLAEIAMEEGISLTDLSGRTGMPLSTVSRIVGALSSHRQRGNPYGLIKVMIVPQERRRKQLYLTARGRAVIGSIADIVGRWQQQELLRA
jgi:DNA-binding MarR family transcriptional regulator